MPSNSIALPSFVTGPQDNLATVDVFSGTAQGIVNSIQSLASKYNVDLIGMLRAGAAAAQALPVIERIANGQVLMNPQAAIARLVTASNTLLSAVNGGMINSTFNSLSSGVQSAIGSAGSVLGEVEVTVGGVVSKIANGAVSDIQSLGGLINSFAGGSGFLMVDEHAIGSMVAGVINQCSRYGIAGAFSQMTKNITNPRVLNAVIASTMPNLVSASDIGGLQALANAANVVSIGAINPNLLSSFTRAYVRMGSGSIQQAQPYQDVANWTQLKTAYATAHPGWDSIQRTGDAAGEATLNLTALQNGTDDFNSTLAAGVFNAALDNTDTTTPFYGLAAVYPNVDVDTELKTFYPHTYIDPALRGTSTVIEPSQVSASTQNAVDAASSTTSVVISNTTTRAKTIQPANDRVGDTPNPATYQTVGGKSFQANTVNGKTSSFLIQDSAANQAWTNTTINWA